MLVCWRACSSGLTDRGITKLTLHAPEEEKREKKYKSNSEVEYYYYYCTSSIYMEPGRRNQPQLHKISWLLKNRGKGAGIIFYYYSISRMCSVVLLFTWQIITGGIWHRTQACRRLVLIPLCIYFREACNCARRNKFIVWMINKAPE